MMRATVLAALLCLASLAPVQAHDLWLTLTGKPERVVVNYGHPADRPPTDAEKLLDLTAITATGRLSLRHDLKPVLEGKILVLESKPLGPAPALLAARYDNGFFVKTPQGYLNSSKRLFPGAAESLWSVKFAKALSARGAPWNEVLGHELEIVPQSDPAAAKVGDTLKVALLFRGRPLAGAQIERGDGVTKVAEKDIPRFATDATGIAAIPLLRAGPQLLAVDHSAKPSLTPDLADADLYNATLAFTLRGK